MAFCVNCGTQLPQEAKFCPVCGTPQNSVPAVPSQPQQSTASTTCPFCGSRIGSFTAKCPSCGSELNNGVQASACQLLCNRLDEIEASRPQKRGFGSIASDFVKKFLDDYQLSPTDQRKAELISHFILPNTKADMMEFIVLAQTRIQACRKLSSDSEDEYVSFVQDELATVWETKLEQTMKKARLILSDDPDFLEFESNYQIQKRKENGVCQYCGEKFKGLFKKICVGCGKEKDY